MRKLILIILVSLIAVSGYSQTNWTPAVGAWQLKDTVGGKNVRFRSNTGALTNIVTTPVIKDSLSNYARLQDGLISGGEATIGSGSVTIATAQYRLLGLNLVSADTTFTGISNSPTGTQYYLLVYGEIGGTLDTISGVRDTIAVIPTRPDNTVSINTVLVGSGGVEGTQPDLTSYITKVDADNRFFKIVTQNEINTPFTAPALRFGSDMIERWFLQTFSNKRLDINDIGNNVTLNGSGLSNTIIGRKTDNGEGRLQVEGDVDIIGAYKINGVPVGSGTVTNVSALTLGTTGTDLNSSVATSTTTPVITLNVPTASASNRGALSSTDWTTFNNKAPATGATGYIQNTTSQQTSSDFYISGTGRATNFGAGIAPNSNHGFTGSASTTTTTPFLITPGASYTGTQNGALHYVTADSTLRMMRFGSSDQVIFNNNNHSLKLSGLPRLVETNSSGTLAATKPIVSILVTDSDIITAITGASYASDRATITPASSKVMLAGQIYDDSTYTYIAIANNVVRRW